MGTLYDLSISKGKHLDSIADLVNVVNLSLRTLKYVPQLSSSDIIAWLNSEIRVPSGISYEEASLAIPAH